LGAFGGIPGGYEGIWEHLGSFGVIWGPLRPFGGHLGHHVRLFYNLD
jgi:hypothetical protein